MSHRLELYLDQVMTYAGLSTEDAQTARDELKDHLLSCAADLEKDGATPDDAVFRAISDLGRPIDVGYGLRPHWPWIDVRWRGTAHGVFAVGPKAVGIFACGFMATGVVSIGVLSIGICSAGFLAFGLVFGLGGVAASVLSVGLNAVGVVAIGILAAGLISTGGITVGFWVFNTQRENTVSLFDANSAPSWLQQFGNFICWNVLETVTILMPFVVIFSSLFAASLVVVIREYNRIRSSHRWMIQ